MDQDSDLLLAVAAEGHDHTLGEYLDGGMSARCYNHDKQTPLHLAAANGHTISIHRLMKEDIDVNAQDKDGKTPLHLAAENGHASTVKVLLDNQKVDIDARDRFGKTPLHYAAENNFVQTVFELLDAGADPTLSSRPLKAADLTTSHQINRMLGLAQKDLGNEPRR